VDNQVWAIVGNGASVFIGGYFKTVNGITRKGVAKLDATTGAVDPDFNARLPWGKVTAMSLTNGRLIIGGTFPGKLRAISPATGADTGYITQDIAGSVADRAGPTHIYRFAVNEDGNRLVAVGNFTTVDGQPRARAFMLDLRDTGAVLDPWYYPPLTRTCAAQIHIPQYLRDVDFAPDGTWFVIGSTGGVPRRGGIGTEVCDAAARFSTRIKAPQVPVWINYTGGDTIHSVAVTDTAVYVQGHFRWLDNPDGQDTAGPGAKYRPGIGAINPTTGLAYGWNPGKTRGVGGKVLHISSTGLWSGSDGGRIGGERHRNIAFLPLP
jgi:hypothetical protein